MACVVSEERRVQISDAVSVCMAMLDTLKQVTLLNCVSVFSLDQELSNKCQAPTARFSLTNGEFSGNSFDLLYRDGIVQCFFVRMCPT